MRIAVANWNRRAIGGIESYVEEIVTQLHALGNDVAFFCEL